MARRWSSLAFALLFMASVSAAMEIPFGARSVIDDGYLGPVAIATGDFDGDGLEDFVAAGIDQGSLAWWRSLGDGSFQRYPLVASATDINDVEVADVNRDGHLDVVVTAAESIDAVGWYENDGTPMDGGWPLRLIAYPFDGASGTAVGDMNGDGTPDVVGTAASAHVVSVAFNNNGTGIGWTYETVDAAFTGAFWVSIGDIDTDGDVDIAAAAIISGEVAWWSSNFDGTWTSHPIAVVANADVIELVDMDSDGDLDALGADSIDFIRWWENDGDGGTWTEHVVGEPSTTIAAVYACDLDRDGDQDVLYTANGVHGVGWFENTDGDAASWQQHVVDGSFVGALDIAPLDSDNDGDLDLVAVDYGADEIASWENLTIHRNADFWGDVTMDATLGNIRDLETVDYDGDGDLDVVYADLTALEIGWIANPGGGGTGWTKNAIALGTELRAVSAADMNADGLVEIVAGDGGNVFWWERLPGSGTTRHTITDNLTQVDSVVTADFDGDGDVDVATGSYVDGIDWFENQGSGIWAAHDVGSGHIWDADCMTAADVDGDGDPDLVYSLSFGVYWMSNDLEEPGFSFNFPHLVAAGLDDVRSVAVGDMDSDGDVDIVAGNMGAGEVLWWANTSGDGSTWSAAEVIASWLPKPQSVGLADFDLDGALEVAVGAYDESTPEGWFGLFDRRESGVWIENWADAYSTHFNALAIGDFDGEGTPDLVTSDARFWPNLGGQAILWVGDCAPATLDPAVRGEVLWMELEHLGASGEADVELAEMELLFTDDSGTPLTNAVLNEALQGVYIYADTDLSFTFDPGLDTVVESIEIFNPTAGVESIVFSDGDSLLQVTAGLSKVYFVAIAFESDAALHLPAGIRVTALERSVVIDDADHDIPLDVAWWPSTSSGIVVPAAPPDLLFADDFESGGTGAWDETAL